MNEYAGNRVTLTLVDIIQHCWGKTRSHFRDPHSSLHYKMLGMHVMFL